MKTGKLILGSSLVVCLACGAEEPESTEVAWGGSEPHLRVTGTLNGEAVDYRVEGQAAGDLDTLACEREYAMPGPMARAQARHHEVEISASVEVAGEMGSLQLELKEHDLNSDPVGTAVRIVPRIDGAGAPEDAMWLDFELNDASDERLLETSAESGVFTLLAWTGQPEADSPVIPDGGSVGGIATARFGVGDELQISFTVNCGESQVEEL